ncbi:MAG UNVERIFIED_CONTAM: hypothetical protein LVR18_15980 [Planctomycetaceae bacterium]
MTAHPHRPLKAAGTVPAGGSLCNDCYESSGARVYDKNPAAHLPPPKPRGLSPRPRRSVTNSMGPQVLSVLSNEPAPPAPSSPKPRGRSPQPGRSVTNSTDLQVLSSLTIVTAPLTPPPPKLRGPSPQPGRSVTNSTDLQVLSSLTIVTAPPTPPPPELGDCPRDRVAL